MRIPRKHSRFEALNRSGRHPACRRAGASSPAEKASKRSTRRNGWQQVRAAGCRPSTAGRMPSATWWFVGRGVRKRRESNANVHIHVARLMRCHIESSGFQSCSGHGCVHFSEQARLLPHLRCQLLNIFWRRWGVGRRQAARTGKHLPKTVQQKAAPRV